MKTFVSVGTPRMNPTVSMCVVWLVGLATPCITRAHDLPLGEVRRDAQVVIFPDRIEVQYAVITGVASMTKAIAASQAELEEGARLAWKRYAEQLAVQIAPNLLLTVDDQPRELQFTRSEISHRHHTTLSFVFAVDLPLVEGKRHLQFVDKNFTTKPGIHRVAAKGRRGVRVENSSKPPIVSRVERRPWESLTAEEKSSATQVACDFELASDR